MLARVECDGEQPGALRTVHGKDGSTQVERLIETGRHAYRFEMVSTGLPVANYAAEFGVEDAGDGTSRVRWHAEFQVTSGDEAGAVAGIRAFLRAGLDGLAARYGRAAVPRLLGINHIALEVRDLEAALAFYRRLFEFELRGGHEGMAFLDMGDQFLALCEGRTQAPDEQRHFGLVVDDRSGLRERAEAAGAAILNGPGLEIRDPWGNRLEVVEYRRVQFTKPDAMLATLNAAPEKSPDAIEELRQKGMSVSCAR